MNAPLAKSLMDTLRAPHFPVYLDYSATTPVDPRVADKMIPYLREQFGNPASRSHMYGWEAEKAVEEARGHVAALVNADPREIIWTSGATEGNNLALKGAAHLQSHDGAGMMEEQAGAAQQRQRQKARDRAQHARLERHRQSRFFARHPRSGAPRTKPGI